MTMLDQKEIVELARLLTVRGKDGSPALRVGLLATLFFADPWTRPVRDAVTDAAEEYLRQFGTHLRWAMNPNGGPYQLMSSGKVPFPRDWLPQHKDVDSWSFGFHGGEGADSASEFQVSAFGSDNVMKDLGFVQFYLPLAWFVDHPEVTFPDLVLSFAKRLHPLSGYAGVGVLESLNGYAREEYQATVRKIAERFPGLEIEYRIGHDIYLAKGIKGVNWLTFLGDRWIHEIGGLDYLRIRLGEDFKLTPYEGGLMIQAGPKPQIGDVTLNRWPRHYVTLARVLKPIQIKNHRPFHWGDGMGVQKSMDHQASLAWLFRFDGK